ncbi:hypothetical protein V498_07819 [Pseudogymnoascus sp. VKM F-4517 (FW-2822)]|nr:hypothetical protein V498_07819 [Pseudogymnoascus sp. VKM F-4517 (FW-2822)]
MDEDGGSIPSGPAAQQLPVRQPIRQHEIVDVSDDDDEYTPSSPSSHNSSLEHDDEHDDELAEEHDDEPNNEESIPHGSPDRPLQAGGYECTSKYSEDCKMEFCASGQMAIRCREIMEDRYKELGLPSIDAGLPTGTTPCYFPGAYTGKNATNRTNLLEFLDHWLPLDGRRFANHMNARTMALGRVIKCKSHPYAQRLMQYVLVAVSRAATRDVVSYFSREKKFDASHLCHQACCFAPDHALLELKTKNMDRRKCSDYATSLRQDGFKIPRTCSRHQPPCLLREASLTREEVIIGGFGMANELITPGSTIEELMDRICSLGILGVKDEDVIIEPFPYSYFHLPGPFPEDFGIRSGQNVVPPWHGKKKSDGKKDGKKSVGKKSDGKKDGKKSVGKNQKDGKRTRDDDDDDDSQDDEDTITNRIVARRHKRARSSQ